MKLAFQVTYDPSLVGIHQTILEKMRSREWDVLTDVRTTRKQNEEEK